MLVEIACCSPEVVPLDIHHNNTIDAVTNASSLQVPLRPNIFLRDIRVNLRADPVRDLFNPTHLYFNLYFLLVVYWRFPDVDPITRVCDLRTHIYPSLDTSIEPVSGSVRLTTAVAATVFDMLLRRLSTYALVPTLFVATLTTRGTPPILIGQVQNHFWPELNSIGNVTTEAVSRTSTNGIITLSNDVVAVRLRFKGQEPAYPPITPEKWLYDFRALSAQIYGVHASSDKVPFDAASPSVVFVYSQGPNYRLNAQINSTRTPAGKDPATWENVVTGLTTILQEVVYEQRFELLQASIYVDGRLAAKYAYFYTSWPPGGQADVATA
ncbi:MAG: hypothetical protein L6R39_004138 [Caloplaca ligustica]|nr:MAG: hypothetical protein L6R39_004138 [Caloplaca ligustica]